MKTLLRLSKLTAPLLPVMALAVLFGTAGFLCAIGIPVLGAASLVSSFPVRILIIAGVARGVLHYLEQYCNHFIAFTLLARIRNIVFAKLRGLGPARIETKEKGSLISLITSDIELLEVFYAHTISPVCIAILVSAGMCVFIAHFSWLLSLVALLFYVLVGAVIPMCVSRSAERAGSIHREQFARMNSFLLDCLRGISMSIMYGTGLKKLEEIKSKSDDLSKSQKKMAVNEGFTSALSGLLVTAGALTMIFVSLALFKAGRIGFSSVVISTAAMFSSFGPVIAVANLGSGLSQTVAAGKRVLGLLDEKPIVAEVTDGKDVEFAGAEAKNVSFGYADENILENFSLEFPKGKIIGIKGKSGSGKSTLLKLLMRFWEADSGEILVSGENVNKINTCALRKIESYITQETVLFHDTIANNIRIAKLDATDEEIAAACKKANVHEFIASLPQKYETQVAELGDNFSGGERQRLGLARAFLHGGDFILLDEPTSNLDSYNERVIMESVKQEAAGKTVVIVSHRDSTFALADKVISLESGRKS